VGHVGVDPLYFQRLQAFRIVADQFPVQVAQGL
jgi:hypothetical protein